MWSSYLCSYHLDLPRTRDWLKAYIYSRTISVLKEREMGKLNTKPSSCGVFRNFMSGSHHKKKILAISDVFSQKVRNQSKNAKWGSIWKSVEREWFICMRPKWNTAFVIKFITSSKTKHRIVGEVNCTIVNYLLFNKMTKAN